MRVPWLLLVAACTFDPNVGAASGPNSVGHGESSGSTSSLTSPAPPEDGSSSGEPGGSSESSDGESGSSGEAPETSGEVHCNDGTVIVVAIEQNDLTDPMTLAVAPDPIGPYAYSEKADAGTVVLEVDVPCDGDYAVWGLVHDAETRPFDDSGNADSFYVRVDNELIVEWSYGCTTLFQVDRWSYERVQAASVLDCATPEPRLYTLEAGTHQIAIRNIESGQHGESDPGSVAAIARIVLTNVEGYTPDPDLD